jgi:hypothetical protein
MRSLLEKFEPQMDVNARRWKKGLKMGWKMGWKMGIRSGRPSAAKRRKIGEKGES